MHSLHLLLYKEGGGKPPRSDTAVVNCLNLTECAPSGRDPEYIYRGIHLRLLRHPNALQLRLQRNGAITTTHNQVGCKNNKGLDHVLKRGSWVYAFCSYLVEGRQEWEGALCLRHEHRGPNKTDYRSLLKKQDKDYYTGGQNR